MYGSYLRYYQVHSHCPADSSKSNTRNHKPCIFVLDTLLLLCRVKHAQWNEAHTDVYFALSCNCASVFAEVHHSPCDTKPSQMKTQITYRNTHKIRVATLPASDVWVGKGGRALLPSAAARVIRGNAGVRSHVVDPRPRTAVVVASLAFCGQRVGEELGHAKARRRRREGIEHRASARNERVDEDGARFLR